MWYTILIALAVDVGGLLLIYVLLRDRLRRAASSESRIAEIREEESRIVVDINQATDRNITLIEDRISSLNEALAAADKKIGLLRREIEKHDVGSQIYSRLAEGRQVRAAAGPARGSEEPDRRGSVDVSGTGSAPREAARAAQEQGEPLAVELSERPGENRAARLASGELSSAPEGPDLRARVMMLHRSGFPPSLIASRVGVPLGEVELIISLEQRKGQA